MKWITRERPKIDRIACPWLIKNFVDKEAEFIYVPKEDVFKGAENSGAIPYDIPGAEYSHEGKYCTYDFIIKKHKLADRALQQIAIIIRGADTNRFNLSPQSAGLWAISAGLSYNYKNDYEMLEAGMKIYDALYSWAKYLQDEKAYLETSVMKNKYSLSELITYFLKLGTIGFGGPVALIGYMHRDLVEQRKWITEDDYKEGLALSQLAPGPLAAQLAIYLGYVDYKIIGATLAGVAFVLPSFIMVLALGYAYVQYGGLAWMQSIFYGVGAAVIGIIAISSYKLTKKTIGKDWLLWIISIVLAVTTFVTENENIWLILAAGFVVWFYRSTPSFKHHSQNFIIHPLLLQISASISFDEKLTSIWWFFLKAGAFVFGSGLAIVPFLYGGLVKEYHWLNEQQFIDAVAVAMITPGPVVITVGFIGYLIAGLPGAAVAALATFLPCYLFTIIPAPYFKKYGKKPGIKAFVDGVTAAAIGAIAGAVIILAKRQFVDITSIAIAVSTILILLRFKVQEPLIIIAAALLGLLIGS